MAKDKPKKSESKTKKSIEKSISVVISAEEYTPPTHSILMGDHPELVGQFNRTEKNGVMCAGETQEMGPETVLYPYRASYIDRHGDVRTWGK